MRRGEEGFNSAHRYEGEGRGRFKKCTKVGWKEREPLLKVQKGREGRREEDLKSAQKQGGEGS